MLTLETFKQEWAHQFPAIPIHKCQFILAVSGGVDSVVLAHLMYKVNAKCTIAHVNFQLRGTESNRDEQFVRHLAGQFQMPIQVHTCETAKYAQTYKMGIQEAAREIRYAWFGSLMQELNETNSAILLTAHHANDNVETVLMQLFRGTGIHGLTGMPARRNDTLNMARPLLNFSKDEIIAYASANGLNYVEDSSNEKDDYTRNLIRNQLLPQIATVFPKVNENIIATAARLKEAEIIVLNTVASFWKKGLKIKKGIPSIPIAYWNKVKCNATYTWGLIKQYGFKPQQIEEVHKILTASKGAYIASSTHRLIQWDHQIQIVANASEKEYITIPDTVLTIQNNAKHAIQTTFGTMQFELIENVTECTINKDPQFAYLDANKLEWPLLFRTWERTDYFYPFGMPKKKKLNSFLGGQKLSPAVKANIAVLVSGARICWLIGKRIDERFKVKPSTTLILKIHWVEAD